eukprot:CAMPEP_0173397842 /NCGR_PEP_ID=MMETSP1356-20130122/39625_1 /TAXON_ID=77927 ORGANISM="Hemiselmis virescens, Strain PCC157" /NCGR_SAMPLE_ID=MMETSP1356 /ASSEMBLY_ACC=CAM_ASM_000847 /LENGTH=174 /DNA_ID=CAMNT_0014357189 /DNA_START=101 /DNA_END=622 /DNA_ORIENTATION=-
MSMAGLSSASHGHNVASACADAQHECVCAEGGALLAAQRRRGKEYPAPCLHHTKRQQGRQEAACAHSDRLPGGTEEEEEEVCPICLDVFRGPLEDYCTPCGHMFHHTCIVQILRTVSADGRHRCPTCRAKLLIVDSVEGDVAVRGSSTGDGAQRIVMEAQPHLASPLEVFLEWG